MKATNNKIKGMSTQAFAKEGYKKTKLGWIPEEWEVQKLGNCIKGKPEYGINAAAVEFKKELPVYIRITDISDDGKFLQEKKTSIDNTSSYKYFLQKNDIVFARTGSTTGKTYLYNSKDGELVFAGFLIRVKPNDKKLSAKYLKLYSETHKYWHWVSIMSTRSGQPGINGAEYAQLEIPLPPLPEQQKIAQILSTWDSAIEKYELLIKKYELRKKGLMQQLLNPNDELKMVNDEWKEVRLGEICKKTKGNIFNCNEEKEGLPVIDASSFNGAVEFYTTDKNLNLCYKSDVLILWDGSNAGKTITNLSGVVGSTFAVLTPNNKVHHIFLCLRMVYDQKRIMAVREGSGIPHVPKDFLNWYRIKIPSIQAQQKIASVISTADKEIEVLKQQLEKLKEQKKGLMQVLLTGKARVKLN